MTWLFVHLLVLGFLMCHQHTTSLSDKENFTHGTFHIERHTSKLRVKRHRLTNSFLENNMTGCHVLYQRKTMKFMTVTSREMTSKEDGIDFCEDVPATTKWNRDCIDKVLFSSHIPGDMCNLEPGDVLNLCLVFFKENRDVYESFSLQ